ncbi:hypothetical protein HDU79_006923 [Rhizoclosmatium sp. JEL0117]|nr:hypothetical protein HDU79_006923 [Rhizoclosmatium sp. JEL0117]
MLARLTTRSLSISANRTATRSSVAMYSSNAFADKESAEESKYVHDHDRELIAKLRKDLAQKSTEHAAAAAALEAAIEAAPKVSPIDTPYGSGARSGAFGKKEAAVEEKYFRDQDKEKLEKLKKH